MPVVERVRAELRGGAAALAFLTRLPLGRMVEVDGDDLARGALAFPLVGAVTGAATALSATALAHYLPDAVVGALALSVAVVLSGGLHIDGLADTADAIGGRSRDAALAIMRDPRVGSYGVAAVALVLLVEASALTALIAAHRLRAVVAAFALARAVAPSIAAALPYARATPGLATSLAGRGGGRALGAVVFAIALVVALRPAHRWLMVGCAVGWAVLAAVFSRRRFAGVTGDTLGAAIAIAEAACLVAACAR
jgi:adenosylcobinamide-GDP ribazoletransferase